MNRIGLAVVILGCTLATAGCVSEHYAYRSRAWATEADTAAMLSTQDVIKMSKAGVGDNTIISLMNTTGSRFRLRAQDVVELADSGVSDNVISAMIKTERQSRGARNDEGYDTSPAYSWYYPYWDPWFATWYPGFWGGYYYSRPYYGRGYYAPHYYYRSGSGAYHGSSRSSGNTRGGGRQR